MITSSNSKDPEEDHQHHPPPPPPLSPPMPDYYFPPGDGRFPDPAFFWPPLDPTLYIPPPPPWSPSPPSSSSSISRTSILTPAIAASVALLGSAILLVSYYRVFAKYCSAWQVFWGLTGRGGGGGRGTSGRSGGVGDDENQDLEQGWLLSMNTGLDESIVKRIPVYVYRVGGEGVVGSSECVVCLGEFEHDDELRILPKCGHGFHLSCIDVWLRSHSNCPLCRAPVVLPTGSPSPPPPLLLSPPVQAMDHREVGEEQRHRHQQQQQQQQDDLDHHLESMGLLPRSRSLSLQLDPPQRKSAIRSTVRPRIHRRARSAESPICYHDMPLTSSVSMPLAPPPPPGPSLLHTSPELVVSSTILCNLREDRHDPEYVVLGFEVVESCGSPDKFGARADADGASSSSSSSCSSSSSSGDGSSKPLLWIRKPGSFKASLKRSLSAGRVFSLRSFARSRSQTQP